MVYRFAIKTCTDANNWFWELHMISPLKSNFNLKELKDFVNKKIG